MGEKHREYYYTVSTSECYNPFAGKPLFTRTDNPLDLGNVIKRNSEKIKKLNSEKIKLLLYKDEQERIDELNKNVKSLIESLPECGSLDLLNSGKPSKSEFSSEMKRYFDSYNIYKKQGDGLNQELMVLRALNYMKDIKYDISINREDLILLWDKLNSALPQKMFDNGYLQHPTDIKKVIFNGPATIVIWHDGSKTVVKCAEGDGYSKFSGLAITICKHIYGPNFKKVFNYFIPKEETECHSSETTNSKQ